MQCVRCGAKWKRRKISETYECPFCGEMMRENLPFRQTIEVLEMLIQKADGPGRELYRQERRLTGKLEQRLPQALRERREVIRAAESGMAGLLLEAAEHPERRRVLVQQACDKAREKGLGDIQVAEVLFIFGRPLNLDTRSQFPLLGKDRDTCVSIARGGNHREMATLRRWGRNISQQRQLADQGNTAAALELLVEFAQGKAERQDANLALCCCRQAAEKGQAEGQYILGLAYANGLEVECDPEQAFEWYRKSAVQGYAKAQFALGEMYYTGEGCQKSDTEAARWMKQAESGCHDPALYVELATLSFASEEKSVYNPDLAFDYAKKAVEAGGRSAMNLLGTMYEEMGDRAAAWKWYSRAAGVGVEMACLNAGAFCQNGYGTSRDLRKGAAYYLRGAKSGNGYCLNALAFCYKNGWGVKKNAEKAFDLFLEAAAAGNVAAEYTVGTAYNEGEGVLQNQREAKKWFRLAAENGFGKAMTALGMFAEKGIPDTIPDPAEALEWYRRAAEEGDDAEAQWILGNCRTHGLMGSYVDELEGFTWYRKAAKQGHATAQNNVALAYFQGELVDQDLKQAIAWFERAVAQQDPSALHNYGTLLLYGKGVDRDVKRGFGMLQRAAELNLADAKASLGVCYFQGWGTERNLDEALRWLSEAYNQNHNPEALQYLEMGFRQKNGQWVKRGIFGMVPKAQPLPPEQPFTKPGGGCREFCEHYAADRSDEKKGRSYCRYLKREVWTKTHCPFYQDGIQNLAELIRQET